MFNRLFRRKPAPAPPPLLRPRALLLPPITLRVLVVVHDPVLESAGGRRLHQQMGWHDPEQLARDYITDLRAASGGLADYQVVEWITVDGYPAKIDGFRYTDATYLAAWRRRSGFHQPDAVDYLELMREFDLCGRNERGEIDEVWLFAFPYAGYYESTMAGAGAFWCNSPPVAGSAHCRRRFVIMGFNCERDVGCMLENFGHRVESIMAHVYRNHPSARNLWERFTRFDRDTPQAAECGNVHFAPSSQADYDWGNRRPVLSRADAWYDFPNLDRPPRRVECSEWGSGDMRAHHLWWLDHLPRVPGVTDGVKNNWWDYVLRVDQPFDTP